MRRARLWRTLGTGSFSALSCHPNRSVDFGVTRPGRASFSALPQPFSNGVSGGRSPFTGVFCHPGHLLRPSDADTIEPTSRARALAGAGRLCLCVPLPLKGRWRLGRDFLTAHKLVRLSIVTRPSFADLVSRPIKVNPEGLRPSKVTRTNFSGIACAATTSCSYTNPKAYEVPCSCF